MYVCARAGQIVLHYVINEVERFFGIFIIKFICLFLKKTAIFTTVSYKSDPSANVLSSTNIMAFIRMNVYEMDWIFIFFIIPVNNDHCPDI